MRFEVGCSISELGLARVLFGFGVYNVGLWSVVDYKLVGLLLIMFY